MRALLATLVFAASAVAQEPVSFADALAKKQLRAEITGNGRDSASLKLTNLTDAKLPLIVPSGLVLAAENGERQIVLRKLTTELAPRAEADAVLPAAALSSKNTATQRTLTPRAEPEPKLAKLLPLFDHQNDLPRPTAQLAIFILLENTDAAAWEKWLAPSRANEKPPKQHPTPAEVAQIVDALAFAKLSAPDFKPALLADENLKRLALRNPWARGKAMVLYGLTIEDAITGDPSQPPDLGKLLHTTTGDNCPICRQRSEMQKDNGL